MEGCCIEPQWPANELLMKYQYVSDFLIALAYFSIPLELIYFVKKSAVFPYKWVLMEFGAFIILCGATHFISMWTFSIHSRTVAAVMAVSKMCTALVSCATALTLIHIIPDLLSVKTRELYLKNKSAELELQMRVMRTQNELGQHVRMLTQEIRSTLDRHTILNRTLVELARTLALEECTLWMPTRSGLKLQLSHSLSHGQNTSSLPFTVSHGQNTSSLPFTVPICHPSIKHVFSSNQALEISSDGPVLFIQSHRGRHIHGDVAAVRVPLLYLSDFHINDWSEPSTRSYALLVLTLPYDSTRRWHDHELELVNAVADQVAVALAHSTALEESWRAQRPLMEQNLELAMARQKAETAIHTRTDFLALMNHEMQMLMYAIVALSILFQKTKSSSEQQFMVNTILNSSRLLHTLIRDILAFSMLEDGSLQLEMRTFSIPLLFHKILKSIQPVASVKKLSFSMSLSRDLPEYAVGDDKRLMQIALNLVGNALKCTRQGNIHVTVCLERPEFLRDKLSPESNLVYDDNHFYMKVQVTDTGQGIHPQDIPNLFTKLVHSDSETTISHEVTGLGLTISKRFVKLMSGLVWIESEGFGKGSTVIFIVKLGFLNKGNYLEQSVANSIQFNQQHLDLSGLKVVLVLENNGRDSMFTRGLLFHLGCDVTVVNSVQECLQVISQPMQNIKVIFLDLCTPESDCYAVAVDVQKMFPTKHERLLLVALIANTDRTTIEKQMKLGMDGVLLKPISLEKMQNVLAELLKGCCLCETIERR